MLKTEDSIWYKKYSMELRERQFLQSQVDEGLECEDKEVESMAPAIMKLSERSGNFLKNLRSMRRLLDNTNKLGCETCKNSLKGFYDQLCLEEKVNLDLR